MADSDNKPVDLTQTAWRPPDGVVNLIKQNNRKLIAKKSTYKENQVVTAKLLTPGIREPRWYERVGNFLFGETSDSNPKLIKYRVRVEEDPRSYVCPEPLNADDNAIDLPQIVCDIDEGIQQDLPAGAKVQIRINNPNTCFTAATGATIIKIIDASPDNWNETSENCQSPLPNSGSAQKSTVRKTCTTTRGGKAGGPLRSTSIPKSTSGKYPRSPTTARSTQGYTKNASNASVGTISSQFGKRPPPRGGGSVNHHGVDIAISKGKSVYAALDGELIAAAQSGNPDKEGAGYYAVIKHTAYKASTPGSTFYTLYMHLTKGTVITSVNTFGNGQKVSAGQLIAKSGDSGYGGAHLHFGVVYDNGDWSTGGQVSAYGYHADPETDFWPNQFEKK